MLYGPWHISIKGVYRYLQVPPTVFTIGHINRSFEIMPTMQIKPALAAPTTISAVTSTSYFLLRWLSSAQRKLIRQLCNTGRSLRPLLARGQRQSQDCANEKGDANGLCYPHRVVKLRPLLPINMSWTDCLLLLVLWKEDERKILGPVSQNNLSPRINWSGGDKLLLSKMIPHLL